MQQKGLAPNSVSSGVAISGCEKDQQFHKVMEFLPERQQKGLAPNAITYSTAISAYGKAIEVLGLVPLRACGSRSSSPMSSPAPLNVVGGDQKYCVWTKSLAELCHAVVEEVFIDRMPSITFFHPLNVICAPHVNSDEI